MPYGRPRSPGTPSATRAVWGRSGAKPPEGLLLLDDLRLGDLVVGDLVELLVAGLEAVPAGAPEGELDLVDDLGQGRLGVLVELEGLADRLEDLGVPTQRLEQLGLEVPDVLDRDVVQLAGRTGPDRDDLLLDGVRRALRLLEQLDESRTTGELGSRGGVEVGGEHGERLHGTELGEVELESTGDRLHRLDLRGAADSGDRDTHVDGRTHVGVEQVGLQVDLAVRDRDDVGRDVRRDVTGLGLDDRQARHRAVAEVVGELGATLEEPRVQVEDVTRVGLTARRTAQQQRHGAVGLGLLAQVVEDDEDVLALVHPVLADGRTGVGREVLEARRVGRGGRDDGGVLQRAGLFERAADRRDGRALLADGDVDAADLGVRVAGLPVALLVDDRVDRDRRLAGLAVADDELALAAADRRHRVDRLDAGLQRLVHRLALHDIGRLQLEGATRVGLDLAEAVDLVAERVDDAAAEVVAGGDREALARALDGMALLDAREVTEDDDADLVDVEVQREAERAVLELEQLVGHGRGQTLDVSDAVTGVGDAADLFAGGRAGLVGLDERVQCVADLLRTDRKLRHVRSSPRFRPAGRAGG